MPSTNYDWVDGQILLPATAAERRGIQSVVTLTANGGERADVAVGQPVAFSALWRCPRRGHHRRRGMGLRGSGAYPVVEPFTNEDLSYTSMRLDREHTFRLRDLLSRVACHVAATRAGR